MSEYIVTCDEETAAWVGNDVKSMRSIVRCRDCVKFCNDDAYYCTDDWCQEFSCQIEPDGFCAWGERKALRTEEKNPGENLAEGKIDVYTSF